MSNPLLPKQDTQSLETLLPPWLLIRRPHPLAIQTLLETHRTLPAQPLMTVQQVPKRLKAGQRLPLCLKSTILLRVLLLLTPVNMDRRKENFGPRIRGGTPLYFLRRVAIENRVRVRTMHISVDNRTTSPSTVRTPRPRQQQGHPPSTRLAVWSPFQSPPEQPTNMGRTGIQRSLY